MEYNQTGWTPPLPSISYRMARKELTPRQSTVRQFIEILGMYEGCTQPKRDWRLTCFPSLQPLEAFVYTNRMEIDISNGTTYLNFCGTPGSTFESPERSSSRVRLNLLKIVVVEYCQLHGPMKLPLSCKRLWIVGRSRFAAGLPVRETTK